MSQVFDDSERSQNPNRSRKTNKTPPPQEGDSTFRANPKKALGPKTSGSKSRTRSTDPEGNAKYTGETPRFYERILFGNVSSGQLAVFCRQFGAYLNAGVDIAKSLSSLQTQFAGTAMGPVLGRIHQSVKRGETLAESMKREPRVFDKLFLGMIQVAEARGGVPEAMRNLSKHYESRQKMIRQARSAMIYPIAVLIIASGVVALLTIVLLPMFAGMLKELGDRGAELPLPSRALLAFSAFVRSVGWFVLPTVFVGTPIVLMQWYKTKIGKDVLDRVAMRLPVFGGLLKKLDITRLSRTLGTLLEAGVDIGSSLTLTSDVLRLNPYKSALRSIRDDVLHGEELSVALDKTRRFGPDVIAVINSGEETGRLPETLDKLADDYEEQVEYTVKNLGQLVQPILLIFLGGIVLFIILAVMLPYISLLTSLGR